MVSVFLADGFEEIEAVTPIDVLRRGEVEVRTVSITESRTVTGAHGIPFLADVTLSQLTDEEDVILLPGGMPGTTNLAACSALTQRILAHEKKGKRLAAICAAPTVFGALGLLKDRTATCYPGMEEQLCAKEVSHQPSVESRGVLTSRGAGTAAHFAFSLLALLKGRACAEDLARAMCFGEDLF